MLEFFRTQLSDRQRLEIVNDHNRKNGIMVFGAHADDEGYVAMNEIQKALDNNISTTLVFATAGEQGIQPHMKGTTPEQMAQIREDEIMNASKHLGFNVVLLGHPDSKEQDHEKEIEDDISFLVRTMSPGTIFAHHPYDMTILFEHRGHRVVGNAASLASQTANLPYLNESTYPVMDFRPGLLLWTRNMGEVNRYSKINRKMRDWRNNYLATYHPSQFPRETMKEWATYFDTISYQRGYGHVNLYKYIR